MALTIASLNVRGLRDNAKRRDVFNWLRRKQFSIYMLQEVHCIEKSNDLRAAEWGYKTIFSTYSSNKAGVCILFNNNFNLQIQRLFVDPPGRFIICDIKANERCFTLGNIYAPNQDKPEFFQDFFNHLSDFDCEDIILGGDFNFVLDIETDKKGGVAKTHQHNLKVVEEFCQKLDLTDVWRILNPHSHRYTWRRLRPNVHCRLNFFLVSQNLVGNTILANIMTGYKTDHSMITLSLSLHSNPRGRGFWKLNTSFLTEIDYINQIKSTISATLEEYKNDDSVNPALLWEMVKLKVREKSLHYAKAKKNMIKQRELELEEKIAKLEEKIDNLHVDNQDTQCLHLEQQLDEQKSELERIIEFRTKGAILRSKTKWYNEGEKNTKYFLNLEKRQYKQGTISQLKTNDNDFATTDDEILIECVTFYKKLYISKASNVLNPEDNSIFFSLENDTVLTEDEQKTCEGYLTEKECL